MCSSTWPRGGPDRRKEPLAAGEVSGVFDRQCPLEEVVDAYRYVETGQKVGIVRLNRYGGLEDMAGVAVMLCSRAGSYFTGEVLNLDGGHRWRH